MEKHDLLTFVSVIYLEFRPQDTNKNGKKLYREAIGDDNHRGPGNE